MTDSQSISPENTVEQKDENKKREDFEKWISRPPYEKSITRYQNNPQTTSWPGQYCDIDVQLAWEAYCKGLGVNK